MTADDIENACQWVYALAYASGLDDGPEGDRLWAVARHIEAQAYAAYCDNCDNFPMWKCAHLLFLLTVSAERGNVAAWERRKAARRATA